MKYNVARFLIKFIYNISGKTLKRPIKDDRDVVEFDWDEKTKKQGLDEMKAQMYSLFNIFKHKNKKK